MEVKGDRSKSTASSVSLDVQSRFGISLSGGLSQILLADEGHKGLNSGNVSQQNLCVSVLHSP